MSKPLVSVIIPVYNGAAYLREAIESALAQTYPLVEVVVIDDGSTDTSSAIALSFLSVRYIYQSNQGVASARNSGIQASKGQCIVFLDQDDLLTPTAIEAGIRALDQNPDSVMAVGDHRLIYADGSPKAESAKGLVTRAPYEALLISNWVEATSSVLFRKDVLVKVGGCTAGMKAADDYELYLRVMRDHLVCRHSTVVAKYRWHTTNMSHNSERMLVQTFDVLRTQESHVRESVALRLAYLKGLRSWSRQYGRQLTRELARDASLTPRRLGLLAKHYPIGLIVLPLLLGGNTVKRIFKRLLKSFIVWSLDFALKVLSKADDPKDYELIHRG
jgi:glycosyltransferase involved in cell wall biosynthesis